MNAVPPEDHGVTEADDQRFVDDLADDLVDALADALTSQRDVEPRHREAARGAFTWRTVDDELMELTYDSLDAPTSVRGAVGTQPRALSFACGSGSLEVELDADVVRGHVVPAAVVTVEMTHASGRSVRTDSAEDGMFELSGWLPGPVRFRVEGDVSGTTPWVTL